MESNRFDWSDAQKNVISSRGQNVLVSAAAGSGKTAVLIERLYGLITDFDDPIDIDNIVVVTFTRAAAAQMRLRLSDRLRSAIDDARAVGDDKSIKRLRSQLSLLPMAQISTLHSYCHHLIDRYFHKIGLDPSTTLAGEQEIERLKSSVADELIEREYTDKKADFMDIARTPGLWRSDDDIKKRIIWIYEKAMAEPFPHEFLSELRAKLTAGLSDTAIGELIFNEVKKNAYQILSDMDKSILDYPDMSDKYIALVSEIKDVANSLLNTLNEPSDKDKYERIKHILDTMSFARLPRSSDEDEKKIGNLRNKERDILRNLKNELFLWSYETLEKDYSDMSGVLMTWIRLTEEFMHDFAEQKKDKGIMDYNDLEQYTLQILYTNTDGIHKKSDVAIELSDIYAEIMIDEYQDSNRVQEAILVAISKEGQKDLKPNRFMVGDVKQSIYRFRNACPELFTDKLNTYSHDDNAIYRKIILDRNYRSKSGVLDATNAVFFDIMISDIGGITYDDEQKLTVGSKDGYDDGKKADIDIIVSEQPAPARRAIEAFYIADKIEDIVKSGKRYSDIVLLAAKANSIGEIYEQTLTDRGIPVIMEKSQGFYDTREISLITQMIDVIDNPRQDIPLAAVLLSEMCMLSEEELASIRLTDTKCDLYDAILKWRQGAPDNASTTIKIDNFLSFLTKQREQLPYVPTAKIIEDIYTQTGIYDILIRLNGGINRQANLDYLMQMAIDHDSTGFRGLHLFAENLRQVRKNNETRGEINALSDDEDAVRIMTIHKSKGLEFSYVFIIDSSAGAKNAHSEPFVITDETGITDDYIDPVKCIKKKTVFRTLASKICKKDDLGEYIRLLYVAMTRAKEKIIFTATLTKDPTDDISKINDDIYKGDMLSMVLRSAMRRTDLFDISVINGDDINTTNGINDDISDKKMKNLSDKSDMINIFDTKSGYNSTLREHTFYVKKEKSAYKKPIPAKISVSELKKAGEDDEDYNVPVFSAIVYDEDDFSDKVSAPPRPAFMQEKKTKKKRTGAERGTFIHHVMAVMDMSVNPDAQSVMAEMQRLTESGYLLPDDVDDVPIGKIVKFLSSPLGRSMAKAYESLTLHREQPFTITKPACDIYPDTDEDTPVMIQGIIDAFFDTGDGLVLLDYKTDRINAGDEDIITDKYRIQIELYKEAIEQCRKDSVKECFLYSFALDKEIAVKTGG